MVADWARTVLEQRIVPKREEGGRSDQHRAERELGHERRLVAVAEAIASHGAWRGAWRGAPHGKGLHYKAHARYIAL